MGKETGMGWYLDGNISSKEGFCQNGRYHNMLIDDAIIIMRGNLLTEKKAGKLQKPSF